ncbi:hypothetical protein HBN50_01325 [Halobacteriovorax sp. GB3]|uniref:hypothetical protein n=1 Tax=Halobacteriovorax sp. GB3 TaxID=2719615 RepID=UPI00235E36E5|nr:hypothetical protein [Halobacteriovorax sp. GB3]MDD0851709.1 hypothetical protein [Halobacteriovorax sp. GB3]
MRTIALLAIMLSSSATFSMDCEIATTSLKTYTNDAIDLKKNERELEELESLTTAQVDELVFLKGLIQRNEERLRAAQGYVDLLDCEYED